MHFDTPPPHPPNTHTHTRTLQLGTNYYVEKCTSPLKFQNVAPKDIFYFQHPFLSLIFFKPLSLVLQLYRSKLHELHYKSSGQLLYKLNLWNWSSVSFLWRRQQLWFFRSFWNCDLSFIKEMSLDYVVKNSFLWFLFNIYIYIYIYVYVYVKNIYVYIYYIILYIYIWYICF